MHYRKVNGSRNESVVLTDFRKTNMIEGLSLHSSTTINCSEDHQEELLSYFTNKLKEI